jgi:tetratricopeptide (TPR) repeat protein
MKKKNLMLLAVFITLFVTAQSFFFKTKYKQINTSPLYLRSFSANVATCQPLYNEADSDIDIPALKGWGHYNWKISGATDSAQFYFNQGISLYYAFHTIESIASFTKATKLAPNCAMAWYGKALAMGPTINYENGYRPAKGALQAAIKGQELSANCTVVEKDLINAMQSRYSADTTIAVRQLRIKYAEAMQPVYARYRQNADVVTLYADALLLLHPWNLYDHRFNAKPWTPQIRSLLEEALALSPLHPGANHYYIHTMEASATPEAALKSAHIMDTLMPGVSHLTHMPSHIYIRTGDYQRGIKVNNEAVAGYEVYAKQYAPVVNGAGLYKLHNIHLKDNCALMAGNYKTAKEASLTLKGQITSTYLALKGADGNFMQYVYAMPLLTDVRFGRWDDILKEPLVDTLSYAGVLQHFSRGVAYARKKQVKKAQLELSLLEVKMHDKELKVVPDNFSAAYDAALVARWILKGVIAEEQKQYDAAINAFQKAVVAEDNLIYNEPRDWPIPARQFLGEVLMRAGKSKQAIMVFNKDLTINPNNGWTLTGLAMAYQTTGNTNAGASVKKQLKSAWKIKDLPIVNSVF